jgi:hypothetical protein
MEFLLYLSPEVLDIYKLISKKIQVVENSPICQKYDFFGFYDTLQKKLSICTSTIKTYNSISKNVSETLLHESVHVAQSCKTNFKYLTSFGINPSIMKLSSSKEEGLNKVIKYDYKLKFIDREAFWMEDKPEKVKYVIQKYCF